jgi:hypothetical protein
MDRRTTKSLDYRLHVASLHRHAVIGVLNGTELDRRRIIKPSPQPQFRNEVPGDQAVPTCFPPRQLMGLPVLASRKLSDDLRVEQISVGRAQMHRS